MSWKRLAYGYATVICVLACSLIAIASQNACTPATAAKIQAVDNTAIDVTNLPCSLAPDSPIGQPWVQIVCWGIDAVEQGVTLVDNAVEGEAGTALAVTSTVQRRGKVYEFQYPSAGAPAFLARHKGK